MKNYKNFKDIDYLDDEFCEELDEECYLENRKAKQQKKLKDNYKEKSKKLNKHHFKSRKFDNLDF